MTDQAIVNECYYDSNYETTYSHIAKEPAGIGSLTTGLVNIFHAAHSIAHVTFRIATVIQPSAS